MNDGDSATVDGPHFVIDVPIVRNARPVLDSVRAHAPADVVRCEETGAGVYDKPREPAPVVLRRWLARVHEATSAREPEPPAESWRRVRCAKHRASGEGALGDVVVNAGKVVARHGFLRAFAFDHRACAARRASARRFAFGVERQRARAALLAIARRFSGVSARRRALPPWLASQRMYSAAVFGCGIGDECSTRLGKCLCMHPLQVGIDTAP